MSTTTTDSFQVALRAQHELDFTRETCERGKSRDLLCQAIATRYDDGQRAVEAGDHGDAVRHFARFVELCERIQQADADAEFGELS